MLQHTVLDHLIMIQPTFKGELLSAVEKLVQNVADYDLRYATVRFHLQRRSLAVSKPLCVISVPNTA